MAPKMRFAYTDAPHGQLHLRLHGEGRPLVLLHWAPASGRLYERVMPHFAQAGFRCFAFDLPGYGRSYKARSGFSIEHMADAILAGADTLGIERFDLVGGHLAASVAAQMAVTAPARVRTLTLDGVLLLEPEELEVLLARFAEKSPMPRQGSNAHHAFVFEMALETLREWNPEFDLTNETLEDVYGFMNDYLEMGLPAMRAFVEPDENAPPPYDIAAALEKISAPTLVLSAELDPLQPSFERVASCVAGASSHCFEGTHPLVTAGRAKAYAAQIIEHMRGRQS